MRIRQHYATLEAVAALIIALAIADGVRSFYSPMFQTEAAAVAFFGVLSTYGALKLRGEDIPDEVSTLLDAFGEMADRMVLAVALIVILLLQILIAGEVLSDQDAYELTHLFDFGLVTIGAFDIAMYLISIWMLLPLLSVAMNAAISALRGSKA